MKTNRAVALRNSTSWCDCRHSFVFCPACELVLTLQTNLGYRAARVSDMDATSSLWLYAKRNILTIWLLAPTTTTTCFVRCRFQDKLERVDSSQWRGLLYSLCFMHSVVQVSESYKPAVCEKQNRSRSFNHDMLWFLRRGQVLHREKVEGFCGGLPRLRSERIVVSPHCRMLRFVSTVIFLSHPSRGLWIPRCIRHC